MHAEFRVINCYDISGVGLVLTGQVENGEIEEGALGMTYRGKKCAVIKIEHQGERRQSAKEKERVNVYVKHITRADVRPGEKIRFD